jgi:hypothetical protein
MKENIIIKTDGSEEEFLLPKTNQLKPLQEAVGGLIEVVPSTHKGLSVVCNEEGKLIGLPINYKATVLHRFGTDPLCGDVVILRTDKLN